MSIQFTCQGEVVGGMSSGVFTRHGKRSMFPQVVGLAAEIAACEGQYLSDYQLDVMRLWDYWVSACMHLPVSFGRLDSSYFSPLRRRSHRAHQLAGLYPDTVLFKQVVDWLQDYSFTHGSPWPEDQEGWIQKYQRSIGLARENAAWEYSHPNTVKVLDFIDSFTSR
jgi:hypothetical protein